MYLWFEGQRAFSRLPALSDSDEAEDTYVTESAFRTQGPRNGSGSPVWPRCRSKPVNASVPPCTTTLPF